MKFLIFLVLALPVSAQIVNPGGGSGDATSVNGAAVPVGATGLQSNGSGQLGQQSVSNAATLSTGATGIVNDVCRFISGQIDCSNATNLISDGSRVAVINKVAATLTVPQPPAPFVLSGQYHNGTATAEDTWAFTTTYTAGANGQSMLSLAHTGSTGGGFAPFRLPAQVQLTSIPANAANTGLCQSGTGLVANCAALNFPNSFGAIATGVETVTFSATPTFGLGTGNSRIVLTGNVTSSTLAAGIEGQRKCIDVIQDATGGRTFVYPTNWQGGMTINTGANKKNHQCATYYTTDAAWVAESAGVSI